MKTYRTPRLLLAVAIGAVAFACRAPDPGPPPDDGTIFTFAPVGQRTFLSENDAGALDDALRQALDREGPAEATRAYANRWVQPPGWTATVEAFGEPTEGDLYVGRGYPYRTNLIDPQTGVVVLAYTKDQPPTDVWQPQRNVQVSGRLEGYARKPPGVVILLDAEFATATGTDAAPTG